MRSSSEILRYPDADFIKVSEKRKNITVYSIEGNISVDKTTFLERLKSKYGDQYEFVPEPVDVWQKTKVTIGGEQQQKEEVNMLEAFYADTPKYAAIFQIFALFTRMKRLFQHIAKSNKKVFIIERSPASDCNVFANTNAKKGNIDAVGLVVYRELYEFIMTYVKALTPDYVIYLRLTPEICHQRLLERKRPEEKAVPIEYLQELHECHETWLLKVEEPDVIPVIVVDASLNYRDDDKVLELIYQQIFIKKQVVMLY